MEQEDQKEHDLKLVNETIVRLNDSVTRDSVTGTIDWGTDRGTKTKWLNTHKGDIFFLLQHKNAVKLAEQFDIPVPSLYAWKQRVNANGEFNNENEPKTEIVVETENKTKWLTAHDGLIDGLLIEEGKIQTDIINLEVVRSAFKVVVGHLKKGNK